MSTAKKTAAKQAAPKAAPAATAAAPEALSQDEAQGEAEASAPAAAPKLAKGEVSVRCAKGLQRFYRAGLRFGAEPTVLLASELDDGVLERLEAEPNLVVVRA